MTWTLSASGHSKNEEDEARWIEILRSLFGMEGSGVSSASISSQHSGVVDLTRGETSEKTS